jgi:hypothetical protein
MVQSRTGHPSSCRFLRWRTVAPTALFAFFVALVWYQAQDSRSIRILPINQTDVGIRSIANSLDGANGVNASAQALSMADRKEQQAFAPLGNAKSPTLATPSSAPEPPVTYTLLSFAFLIAR